MSKIKVLAITVCAVLFLNQPLHANEPDSADNANFRFAPLGLLIGLIDLNLDFKIAPNWTLGPELMYWHFNVTLSDTEYDVSALVGGVRANWFKNGVYTDGLYVGPALLYTASKVKWTDGTDNAEATNNAARLSTVVGYGWFWDSFNMMLGGGLSIPLGDGKIEARSSNGRREEINYSRSGSVAFEYSLGWTF